METQRFLFRNVQNADPEEKQTLRPGKEICVLCVLLSDQLKRAKVHRLWEGFDEEWAQPGVIYKVKISAEVIIPALQSQKGCTKGNPHTITLRFGQGLSTADVLTLIEGLI